MSKLGGLPEGVDNAMFLRDGWPYAVVCKVVMKDGCVGIGTYRSSADARARGLLTPEMADQLALLDAMQHVAPAPPDYSEIHAYMAQQKAAALQEEPETDEDLQAALGQKAHD